ncbi:MAG: hypothetical protein DRN04_18250 [Thermoprotei archaeon]|nr:MAG: hypothetical protein DRN04_18250 [Thermoprotei archaeon]
MRFSKKREAATLFTKEVLSKAKHIYAIYLFGSLPKGMATPESDVDLLVVYSVEDKGLHDILANASSKVYRELGEVVEYVTMSIEEYLSLLESSPFLYEVRKWGEILYMDGGEAEERARQLAKLAREYAESAEKCISHGMLRLALDAMYNAVELILKALIIAAEKPLPRTHGGYIHVFNEIYRGKLRENMLRDLMKALELRNKARYEPSYTPTLNDIELCRKLYSEVKLLLEDKILNRER